MIKEIVDEIKKAETEAEEIKTKAGDSGNEMIRKASKKADHIKNSIHKERKGIIQSKVEEADRKAKKESKNIVKEAEIEANRMESDARKYLDKAIQMVYERVTSYGN